MSYTGKKSSPMNNRVPEAMRAAIVAFARARGESLTRFILLAITERCRHLWNASPHSWTPAHYELVEDAERAARESGLRFE